jgi:hypothetical protein
MRIRDYVHSMCFVCTMLIEVLNLIAKLDVDEGSLSFSHTSLSPLSFLLIISCILFELPNTAGDLFSISCCAPPRERSCS